MPIQTTQTLANILARGAGLGIRKAESIEEAEERNRELARDVAAIERQRKAQKKTGIGRLLGLFTGGAAKLALPQILSALGAPATGGLSLLIPGLAAGAGSYIGQRFATRDVARERLPSISPGAFQVGRGREREERFRLGERAFGEELGGGMLGSALMDAFSAAAFQKLLQGKGGLRGLFGKSQGVTFPGGAPEALRRVLNGLGPAPGSIEQSLIRALEGGSFDTLREMPINPFESYA